MHPYQSWGEVTPGRVKSTAAERADVASLAGRPDDDPDTVTAQTVCWMVGGVFHALRVPVSVVPLIRDRRAGADREYDQLGAVARDRFGHGAAHMGANGRGAEV